MSNKVRSVTSLEVLTRGSGARASLPTLLMKITNETEAATLPLPIFDSTSDAANAATTVSGGYRPEREHAVGYAWPAACTRAGTQWVLAWK